MDAGISKPYLSNIETGKLKNPPTDGVLEALEQTLQFAPADLTRLAHLARTPTDIRREFELYEAELQKLRAVFRSLAAEQRNELGEVDIEALAERLGMTEHRTGLAFGAEVPIINKVAAGYPDDFSDLDYPPGVAEEYVRCPDITDPHAFAAYVSGDSMSPKYKEGDIVVFSPETEPAPGNDCFVRFEGGGGTSFKRYYRDDENTIRLQPLNNAYPAQIYPREQITGLWPAVLRIEQL